MVQAQATHKGDPPPSLSSIAEDLLARILCCAAPEDIIQLRKTCRSLHAASTRRFVWLHALRSVMYEHQIFLPTYDLDSMSIAQLEAAAIRPAKVVKKAIALNNSEVALQPRSHRVLVNWQDEDEEAYYMQEDEPRDFAEITHIPGGRFLITTSDNYSRMYVKLWDLGQPGDGQSRISLLATMKTPADVFIHVTAPTPDGTGIRIFAAVTAHNTFGVKVYEIFPLQSSPTFKEIAFINTNGFISSIGVSGNRVICTTGRMTNTPANGIVLVWDYVHNIATTFQPSLSFPREVYLWGDYAVLYHTDTLTMWKIPALRSGTPNFDEAMPVSLPVWQDAIPFSTSVGDYQAMPYHQMGWFPATAHCRYIIICGTLTDPSAVEFLLYKLEGTPTSSDLDLDSPSDSPSAVPTLLTRARFDHEVIHAAHSFVRCPPQICDHHVVMTCFLEERMLVLAFPVPDEEEVSSPSTVMCKFRIGDMSPELVEFSAATGRAFLFASDTGELRVVDYIDPR
ncbi:hypothetical protein GALMADRAFT_136450 [Galerina marginata CBS 339.88]|uniref:F-box domain-containing protein n=1 Tax=Galerina marginata (strain CBS 339.88) TaxID=685588 RepID=A0A067TBY5_GALM3|nr:hypothetical protein GALMADRAFT_136450 [Galerina marginata CBS 339.88]